MRNAMGKQKQDGRSLAGPRGTWLAWTVWALLAAAAHGGTLRGLVVDDATSRPLAGATIYYGTLRNPKEAFREDVGHFKDSPLLMDSNNVRSGEDGTFHLEENAERRAILLVRAEGHAWRGVLPAERARLADPAQPGRLRIALSEGATLSGALATTTTARATRVQLRLQASPSAAFVEMFPDVTTGQDGAYRWAHLPAGRYEVGLYEVAGGRGHTVLARRTELANGDDKTVDLGKGLGECVLRGRVVSVSNKKPVAGANIDLQPQFDWDYSVFGGLTDAEGRYRIGKLRPGQYRVTVHETNLTGRVVPNAVVLVTVAGDTERDIEATSKGLP